MLRLKKKFEWRGEPGPLSVVGVDTGNGEVNFADNGILVTNIVAIPRVKVDMTGNRQVACAEAPEIVVTGTGFNINTTMLRFTNGIHGIGINYAIASATETSLTLRLVPGSVDV